MLKVFAASFTNAAEYQLTLCLILLTLGFPLWPRVRKGWHAQLFLVYICYTHPLNLTLIQVTAPNVTGPILNLLWAGHEQAR